MAISEIARAWRDEEFRSSLSASQLSELPSNPVGMIELKDEDLGNTNARTSPTCTCSAHRSVCTYCCV